MADKHRFDLSRADTLSRDLQCVVATAEDIPLPVLVDHGPIAMGPHAGPARPVGLQITLAIVEESPGHTDPRPLDNQFAHTAPYRIALLIEDVRCDARAGRSECTRFYRQQRVAAKNAARDFRSSGVIDYGHPPPANVLE